MEDLSGLEAAPGVLLKPFWGQRLMASYVTFAPNSVAPLHQHEQEQLSLVLKGRLFFTVGDQSRWMEEGDVVSIPGGVPHVATAASKELSRWIGSHRRGRDFNGTQGLRQAQKVTLSPHRWDISATSRGRLKLRGRSPNFCGLSE